MTKKSNIETVRSMLDEAGEELFDQLSNADDERLGYATVKPSGDFATFLYVDQIPDVIEWSLLNPELHSHTMCFLGSSAIGKTYAVREGFRRAAEKMGRPIVDAEGNDTFHEMHVSQLGPTDILGVPRDDGHKRTDWYVPKKFALKNAHPEHDAAYQRFVETYRATGNLQYDLMKGYPLYGYFWDEVTNPSQPSIVHQCFSLWYGNYVADHPLVGDAFHVLAGNRVQDRTNSIYLAASATTRLGLIEAVPRLSGWLKAWAMQPIEIADEEFTRVHPLVIAYLHRFSDRFSPDASTLPQMTPFPSPRTWTYVSDLLYANDRFPLPDNVLFASVAGRIGQSDARLFWAFRDHWKDLPDINKMLNSPAKPGETFGWLPNPWPKRTDVQVIMGTQMISKLNARNAERFMAFMSDQEKFPPEIAAMTMKLLRPSGKLDSLSSEWDRKGFSEWSRKFRSLLF